MNKEIFDAFVDMVYDITADTFPDAKSVKIEVFSDGSVTVEPEFNTISGTRDWDDFADEMDSCNCCDCGSCGCCDD